MNLQATPIGRASPAGSADLGLATSAPVPGSATREENGQRTPTSVGSGDSQAAGSLGVVSTWFLALGTCRVRRVDNMARGPSDPYRMQALHTLGPVKRVTTILSTMRFLCTPRMQHLLLHWPIALLICLATLCALGFSTYHVLSVGIGPDLFVGRRCPGSRPTRYWYLVGLAVAYGTQAVFMVVIAAYLLCRISSRHLRWVACFMVLAWLKAYMGFWYVALLLGGTTDYTLMCQVLDFLSQSGLVVVIFWIGLQNTRSLERGMMVSLGSRRIEAAACPLILTVLVLIVFLSQGRPSRTVWSLLVWCIVGSMLAFVVLTLRALGIAWHRLACIAQRASLSGPQREEVLAAKRACLALMLWTGAGLLSSLMNLTSRYFFYFYLWPFGDTISILCMTNLPVDSLDCISNAGIILVSSGVLTGAVERSRTADACETARRLRRLGVIMSHRSSDDQRWEATVRDLANRGFTLRALLDFYRGLGDAYMPHFDPARSTTKDVVHGAIIPLSRPGKCALATTMMQGVPTKPKVMVTHAWSTTFRDTVAAIVAHALDDSCFEFAARMLDGWPGKLEEMLAWRGVLDTTYWVCAFSVNQHASICGSSRDVDTVTGQPYEVCSCGHQKFWSETLPVTGDGRSIRCEMNKFDDMMHYMAMSDKDFCQLLCLDRQLNTLSRCWCVAEVVEAHKSGMHPLIKCFSRETLQAHRTDLSLLRVEDMQASHPEDVQAILSKIEDKKAFNERYRSIVMDGLAQWMDLPLQDQIHDAGRCWLHAMY